VASRMSSPVSGTLIDRAVSLAAAGMSYRRIGALLGVDESLVRRDERVRAARIATDPDAHSVTRRRPSAACRVLPATEQIERVELILSSLLGEDYSLSSADRRRLSRVLTTAIGRIDHE
jgi:hypothetical protein